MLPAARPAPGGAGGSRPGRCLPSPAPSHGGREELPVRLVREEEGDTGLRDPRRRRPEPADLSLRGAGPAASPAPPGRARGAGPAGMRGLPGPGWECGEAEGSGSARGRGGGGGCSSRGSLAVLQPKRSRLCVRGVKHR